MLALHDEFDRRASCIDKRNSAATVAPVYRIIGHHQYLFEQLLALQVRSPVNLLAKDLSSVTTHVCENETVAFFYYSSSNIMRIRLNQVIKVLP